MKPTGAELLAAAAAALERFWDTNDVSPPGHERRTHAEQVAGILRTNLRDGRWHRVLDGAASSRISSSDVRRYAERVARHYWREQERVAGLRAKDQDRWEELHHQLRASAYRTLRTRVGLAHRLAYEQANDYAQRACELIFRARYPFDVPFQAWALRILLSAIWAQEARSGDLLDRATFVDSVAAHLAEADPLESVGQGPEDVWRWEAREVLRDAIQRLASRAQQEVIVLDFWRGRSSAEIARELGRSTQAVYNLRHRALNALRETLESPGNLFSR